MATNFSEDIRGFSNDVYIAGDEGEFVGLINLAIAEDSPEKIKQRYSTACSNTWSERVREFWEVVESTFEKKGLRKEKSVSF